MPKKELTDSEARLGEVRFKHHEQRRRGKFSKASSVNLIQYFLLLAMVLKLYDYMGMMSSISPTVQKNKNASQIGFGQLSVKSQRNRMSPQNQDRHNFAAQHARVNKDLARDQFHNMVGNLPQINRKQPTKGPVTTSPSKKIKRKADVPAVAKPVRATQSIGPSGAATEASTRNADYSRTIGNSSVTKGQNESPYPDYFFKPKENLFEGARGSRYDSNKPKAFHLTQPDTNLAKFVFSTQQDFHKKRGPETQSLNNYNSPLQGGLAASNVSIHHQRSPKSVVSPGKNRSYLRSHHSIDSDNTIQNFLMKDQCGKIIKTEHILAREQDRVDKVKRARENAIQIALEKEAKLILQERKYETNTKRHQKLVEEI